MSEVFSVKTSKNKELLDLTQNIDEILKESGTKNGLCNVFVKHTTCALMIIEMEQWMEQDFFKAIEKMFPHLDYRHAHNPNHVGEHIMSSIIGQGLSLPIKNGKLDLGTWQSVVLVEFSGPREREIVVNLNSS